MGEQRDPAPNTAQQGTVEGADEGQAVAYRHLIDLSTSESPVDLRTVQPVELTPILLGGLQ